MRRAAAALGLSLCLGLASWPGIGTLQAQEFHTLKGHGGPIMDIAVDPASGRIATASFDNAVGLWTARQPRWFDGHRAAVNAVLFLNAGQAVSAGDDNALILWDLATGAATRKDGHTAKVMALALSPDGKTVASASWDGTVGLWPLAGGAPRFLRGHDAGVNDVAFAADGRRLFSASSDGTIRSWDPDSGAGRALVRNGFGINRMVLHRGGEWLAYGAVDGGTRVVDPDTGAALADFSLDRRPILAMAADAPQRHLAVGDGHGFIMMIDTQDWRITRDFRATLGGPIWALAFSADGQVIHAGGIEDIVYAWPVAALDEYEPLDPAPRSFQTPAAGMGNGERQFMRKCSICHALGPGPSRRAGPTLHGVFGRAAGQIPGYVYSDTLRHSDIVWSDDTLDALFDEGPDHYIPGSKMPMQRIRAAQDRSDLISFLREATAERKD